MLLCCIEICKRTVAVGKDKDEKEKCSCSMIMSKGQFSGVVVSEENANQVLTALNAQSGLGWTGWKSLNASLLRAPLYGA